MKHSEVIKNDDRFCLHDGAVSKIGFADHNLILTFSEGFWETDCSGALVRQRENCKVTYKFLIAEDEELNLHIGHTSKGSKEVEFEDFCGRINKHGFRIYREFRSAFSKAVILEGNIPTKGDYFVFIGDIEEIIYECDDTHEEMVDEAAKRILKKYSKAFEELAK